VTYEPNGDDCPSDYSPNGKRLVITRASETTYELDTVKLDGSGLKRITPEGMEFNFCEGSWSAQGNQIAFSAHVPNGDYHSSVWVVHFNGAGLHQLPIAGPAAAPSRIRPRSGASGRSARRTGGRSSSGATKTTASATSTPSTPTEAASSR
jgi:Tol biopolymer transport system component